MTPSSDAVEAPTFSPAPAGAARHDALWRHRLRRLLAAVATTIEHSALSLALSQRGELACALLDGQGRSVAEHGDPLRAGAIGAQVRAALADHAPLTAGQILAMSEPQHGGAELGTLTLVALVVGGDGALLGYLAVSGDRGDCAQTPAGAPESLVDVTVEALPAAAAAEPLAELPPAVGPRYRSFHAPAGTAATGLPRRREQEGWALPPALFTDTLAQSLAQKQRDPSAALADLKAMRGGLRLGVQQLRTLEKRHGAEALRQGLAEQHEATRAALAAALQRVPPGVCAFADSLDDDGTGTSDLPVRLTVSLGPEPGRLTFDFRESADAAAGAVNTVPAVVHAAVRSALAALVPAGVAVNDGLLATVAILLRPGSLLAAGPEHAVAAGASETARRVIDVVLGALSQALPRPLQAASAGTASWLCLRPPDVSAVSAVSAAPREAGPAVPAAPRRLYLRESLAGGQGARPQAGGATGRYAPGPGPRPQAIPCELLEQRLPVRVLRQEVRRGSGGGGVQRGGDGLVRELLLLCDLHVELCGDRRRRPPYGLGGGGPGQLGRDTLVRAGIERLLPAKARLLLRAGDILRTETPGGGGYGDPMRAAFYAALLS